MLNVCAALFFAVGAFANHGGNHNGGNGGGNNNHNGGGGGNGGKGSGGGNGGNGGGNGGSSNGGGGNGGSSSGGGSSSSSSDVVYSGSMTSGLNTFPPTTVDVTVTEDTVTISLECWATGGWCGFGFGQGHMEGSYAIVSTNDGVSEYILTKNNEGGVKGDQSENEIDSGLVTLESTADFLTRSATVTIPRESDDRFSFPFDPTGNTNTLVVTMITAKADYYEPELFFHGSQCQSFESLALTVEGGSKRHKESSKRRKESSLFADLELEGDAATKELTMSEMLFGAVLLVVAAFAIDQLWRWSTSDGSKLQVSTGDEEDAPLLNADKA